MPHFFRLIRKKLIEQDQVRKYLLYALGEILLVVIGILIALQVNTWNQNRIDAKRESRYIDGLIRDMEAQLVSIDRQIEIERANLENLNLLLDEFQTTRTLEANETNLVRLHSTWNRMTFTVVDPTYAELLATGNIELIRNDSLRNQIILYYQRLEKAALIIQKNNDMKDIAVMPVVFKLIDMWPPGAGSVPGQEDMMAQYGRSEFPQLTETFHQILSDKNNLFTVLNVIKTRLMMSSAAIADLKVEKEKTEELIRMLRGK